MPKGATLGLLLVLLFVLKKDMEEDLHTLYYC